MSAEHPDHARWLVEHVLPHEPLLRAWLHGKFGAQVEIDDIVQDAYARLLRARAQGTVVSPKAFLFHTARNLALNHVRHRSYCHPAEITGNEVSRVVDTGEGVAETVARAEANWRGVLNIGRQQTVTQIDNTWWKWVEQRLPVWKTFGAGWDVERYTAASALTVHQIYDQWVATQRDPLIATNGIVVSNQREWRVNGVLTHVFTDGRLRGATVGLGGRWRSANTLGYRLTTTAAGQQVLDLNRPIKGSSELAVDTFATYALRKLGLGKLKSDWKLQLNVRNLLDGDGLIPTQVLTNGTPSIFTFRTPRQFILTLQVEL